MKIGVIGVCNITMDFADRASKCGHEVLISGMRNNETLRPAIERMGNKVKLVSRDKAAKAKIILVFIPREDLQDFLNDLPDMSDKVLIHTNNPVFSIQCLMQNNEIKSSSDIIASSLPSAHVVKMLNIVEPEMLKAKKQVQTGNEVFFTGANRRAKNRVKMFLKTLNLSGIDFGELYRLN